MLLLFHWLAAVFSTYSKTWGLPPGNSYKEISKVVSTQLAEPSALQAEALVTVIVMIFMAIKDAVIMKESVDVANLS